MITLTVDPRDVLFFRDGRPMGGSSTGNGADWPLPSAIHQALITAFHDHWPTGTEWESEHRHFSEREKKKFAHGVTSTMRFGGLRTMGPFPVNSGRAYTPTPADLTPNGLMAPVNKLGSDNLPVPLVYPVANPGPPSKEMLGAWMAMDGLSQYLEGEAEATSTLASDDLYVAESRPGVGIDPDTHASEESVFYQAEYLRLRNDTSLAVLAEAVAKQRRESHGHDLMASWLEQGPHQPLVLGGQRGVAYVRRDARDTLAALLNLPPPTDSPGGRLKWVLLTPALFDGGWRPDWIDADGRVLLRKRVPRRPGETRRDWRRRMREEAGDIDARLVAARVPKPLAVSGWKLDIDADHAGGAPKPTRLLAPAGSVYYFECGDDSSARALASELHGHVKSQRLGEKGFGFGVCGTWDFLDL